MTDHSESAVVDAGSIKKSWFKHGTSRIYYEESGTGDPVLMLPGWSMSIDGFAALRQALTAAGYHVIAADLPGSGRSEPQPRTYSASYFEDDARSMAALLQHLKIGSAHIIGFSDGGEDAFLMAALFSGVVRSVVTWGASGVLRDPSGQLREAMYNVVDHPIPPLQGFREHLVNTYGEANARAMSQSEVSALSEIIEKHGGDVSISKADNITCPALLITGEHDMFVPPALLYQLAAHIKTTEVHVVQGAGHDVHNSHPDWIAKTILDWLSRH